MMKILNNFIIFVFLIFFIKSNVVIAIDNNIENLVVKITTDFEITNVTYTFTIQNKDPKQIINSIEVQLPFINISDVKVFYNNSEVKFSDYKKDIFYFLNIDLSSKELRFGQSGNFKITFLVNDLVEITDSNIFLKVNKKINYLGKFVLSYPKSYGLPIFSNIQAYNLTSDNMFNILEFTTLDPFFFVFGNKNTIDISMFGIVYPLISKKNYILNLLPVSKYQSYLYSTLFGIDTVFTDKYGNNFGVINFSEKNNTYSFNFSARIFKDKYQYDKDFFKDIDIDYLNTLYIKNDYSFLKFFEDPKDSASLNSYIENLYQTILEYYNLDSSRYFPIDLKYFTNENFIKNNIITQTEFCLLLDKYITNNSVFGINDYIFFIAYGYLMYPEIYSIDFGEPHLWCELLYKDNIYIFDPLLSKKGGHNFVRNTSSYARDRIYFGVWDPTNEYDNLLGLKDNVYKQKIYRTNINLSAFDFLDQNDIEIDFLNKDYNDFVSGQNINQKVFIKNKSNKIIPIKNLIVNENIKIKQLKFFDLFYISILPQQRIDIEIFFEPQNNIFFTGQEVFQIKIDSFETIKIVEDRSFTVNFVADTNKINHLILFFVGLLVLVLVVFFVYLFIYKKTFIKNKV